jgi:membrane-associated protease RseP (regulator of RpoE activity)
MLDFGSIRNMLEYRFTVLDAYVDVNGLPTFIVVNEPVRRKFQELLQDLRNHNLTARIQRVSDKLVVSVFPKPNLGKPRKLKNLILFFVTLGTVTFASYTLIFWADSRLMTALFSHGNLVAQVVLLTLSILGIIGIHEMGHVLAVRHHKMDATLPYFVPGLPPIGTFGAVISLRGPPGNRDQLFDLGISGPIAGFITTIFVAIFAYLTAPLLPDQQVQALVNANLLSASAWPNSPLLIDTLGEIGFRAVPAGHTLVLTQLAFAAQIGALITFLNLLPVWQLDGGHIARALFGTKGHKIVGIVSFAVLLLAGYWPFALLLIIVMVASRRPLEGLEPLDDVSPLSNSRRALSIMALVMLIFCFVIIT